MLPLNPDLTTTPHPPTVQVHSHQQCQPLLKTHLFKQEIRNQQLGQFKSKIRDELIQIKYIEDMLEEVPEEKHRCAAWAEQLFELYRLAVHFRLDPFQSLQLYKIAEKFPNRVMLQLLQIVIFKAEEKTLDELFQFDIMRLLHGAISPISSSQKNNKYSDDEKDNLMKYRQQLQLAKIGLRIIAELCRKKAVIRNYVVLNHKSYKYWQQTFRQFGTDIQLEYYQVLEMATAKPFSRREQEFSKIENSIVGIFAQDRRWDLLVMDEQQMMELSCILKALKNIFAMKSGWLTVLVRNFENRINKSLHSIILGLIQDFNCLLVEQRRVSKTSCEVVTNVLHLAMHYQEHFDGTMTEYYSSGDMLKLVFELLPILREGYSFPELAEARSHIYFLISNLLIQDSISDSTKYSLFVFDHNIHRSLLKLLANQLYYETDEAITYELCHLLMTSFMALQLDVIEPLVIPSQVLQSMCTRILEGDFKSDKEVGSKLRLIEGIIVFIEKMDSYDREKANRYRSAIRQQFEEPFKQASCQFYCEQMLSQKIGLLLDRLSYY